MRIRDSGRRCNCERAENKLHCLEALSHRMVHGSSRIDSQSAYCMWGCQMSMKRSPGCAEMGSTLPVA